MILSIGIVSCKKCKTCSGGCFSCTARRGPTIGQIDTLCSKDFKDYNAYLKIVVEGDSLDCIGIPSLYKTYSSCDPNLPSGAICQ